MFVEIKDKLGNTILVDINEIIVVFTYGAFDKKPMAKLLFRNNTSLETYETMGHMKKVLNMKPHGENNG